MQNKGNILFHWTMKLTKHFKPLFCWNHVQQTDTARKTDIFCIYLKNKAKSTEKKKKTRQDIVTPKQPSKQKLELFWQWSILGKKTS